jgi:hypothetical protein
VTHHVNECVAIFIEYRKTQPALPKSQDLLLTPDAASLICRC